MNIRSAVRELARKSYEGESRPAEKNILDCALGRNLFGTSERVTEFARHYDGWSDLYQPPDTSYKELKQAICQFWSDYAELEPANVKVANGSSIVLSRLNKLFIEPGVKVLGYVPQFKEYMVEVMVLGGTYEAIPLDPGENLRFNPDRFLRKVKEGYDIVYIDNPNNPTGQLISLNDIEIIVQEAARKDVVVIIDEAYGDYVEEKFSAINLINKYKNLVVTRTFTKGYGIGRFRVGYAVLSTELGDYYNRVDLPFSISAMGASLAKEALLDQDFILRLRQQVKAEKEKLTRGLRQKGYLISETCESCPIFILGHRNKGVDLKGELLNGGILTTSGNDFVNLNKSYARVNTPPGADSLLARL